VARMNSRGAEVERGRVAETYLDEVRARLAPMGATDVETIVWYGPAAVAIIEAAAFHKVSLIAMTTHGRTRLERLVLGSVAESVLRGTPTPILLLRAEGAALDMPGGHAEARVSEEELTGGCPLAQAMGRRAG